LAAPAGVTGHAELMSPILGSEDRRPVTVVFVDIVGFTSLSEKLDPEEVRDVTAACFGRLVEEVARRGGTVDKFIGDAVMALFGAPVAHDDDPIRAVDAALSMQAAIGEINGDLERDHGVHLELRIGINSGEVVAGVREVGGLRDFTVIGDTVNTASRLQTAAHPGHVVVGEATAALTRHAFDLEPLPPLSLRGKAEPVSAYRVLGPLRNEAIADSRRVPLVGRERELAQLRERLDRVVAGEGQVVMITGDTGVGKTRLAQELERLVARDGRFVFSSDRAAPYGPRRGYRVYATWTRDTFRDVIDNGPTDPSSIVSRIEARVGELGVPEAAPFALHMLDLPLTGEHKSTLTSLTPAEIQHRARVSLTRVVAAASRDQPFVFVLDDLQWADGRVADFLVGAFEATPGARIMWCVVMRNDDSPARGRLIPSARALGPDHYIRIDLPPLGTAQMLRVVSNLLGGTAIDATAEERLLARAGGNPLFVEELVRTLIERAGLVLVDGRWRLAGEAANRVPETLQAAILARIDRLPPEARLVIQTGAVLGQTFDRHLLARMIGDESTVERGLAHAIAAGMLCRVPPETAIDYAPALPAVLPTGDPNQLSTAGYCFAQGLIQEVAERNLLLRRRRELHQSALRGIEELAGSDLSSHIVALAHHAIAAEDWPKALDYSRRAGDRALRSYANEQALAHFQDAIEAAARAGSGATSPLVVRLHSRRAEAQARMGRLDEAAVSLTTSVELAARTESSSVTRAHLALDLANIQMLRMDVAGAESAVAIAMANLHSGSPALALALGARAWVKQQRDDLKGAARDARAALRVAQELGGMDELFHAYRALTMPVLAGEIGPVIREYAHEAVFIARQIRHDGYLFDSLLALEMLGMICLQILGERSLENVEEALAIAHRLDSAPRIHAARVMLGGMYLLLGRWDEADHELSVVPPARDALPMYEALRELMVGALWTPRGRIDEAHQFLLNCNQTGNFPHAGVWTNVELAYNRLFAGEFAEVRRYLARAEAEQARLECLSCEAFFTAYGGEMLAHLGDPHARELADRAGRVGQLGFSLATVMAERTHAILAARAREWETALFSLKRALDLMDHKGQPQERARTLVLLGEAWLGRAAPGDLDRAAEALDAAIETFERIGAIVELERARELRARVTAPAF
jgi:class 3 adenylate cyclase/tetratricopeptide (TPR) repeat protein